MNIVEKIDQRFTSGNSVEVERISLTRDEWLQIKALSVTNILIDEVGDGKEFEMYAKSAQDLVDVLTNMRTKIEDYELAATPSHTIKANVLAVIEEVRNNLSNQYTENVQTDNSDMGGNCDWARLEGAVKVLRAIQKMDVREFVTEPQNSYPAYAVQALMENMRKTLFDNAKSENLVDSMADCLENFDALLLHHVANTPAPVLEPVAGQYPWVKDLNKTTQSAGFWLENAKNHNSVRFAIEAVNHWKNAAYWFAEKHFNLQNKLGYFQEFQKLFDHSGPMFVSDPALGAEPNLRFMVHAYYANRFHECEATSLTDRYIRDFERLIQSTTPE